jgi:hypothetical protein
VTRESIEAHVLEADHNLEAHNLEAAEGLALDGERAVGAERHVHLPHPAFAFRVRGDDFSFRVLGSGFRVSGYRDRVSNRQ